MREVQEFMFLKKKCLQRCNILFFISFSPGDSFHGYGYLGNSLYSNSLIYLASTGGLKQQGALDGCVLLYATDSISQMTIATNLKIQYSI